MNVDLIRKTEDKENKTEAEWELLSHHKTLVMISETLVSESKLDITSEEAIFKIRSCMKENF